LVPNWRTRTFLGPRISRAGKFPQIFAPSNEKLLFKVLPNPRIKEGEKGPGEKNFPLTPFGGPVPRFREMGHQKPGTWFCVQRPRPFCPSIYPGLKNFGLKKNPMGAPNLSKGTLRQILMPGNSSFDPVPQMVPIGRLKFLGNPIPLYLNLPVGNWGKPT